jgi:uncharacterized protein with HEPN domain
MKCIESVEQFTKGVSKKDFWNNDEKQSAIFRKLEIIGEAANHTSTLFRKKYPEIPWRDVCGLRNRLTHEYFGINAERVWNIIKDDLARYSDDTLNTEIFGKNFNELLSKIISLYVVLTHHFQLE